MADAVAVHTLLDGKKNAIMKFTNVSDGTGESAVLKVDVSTLTGSPSEVRIDKIWYSTQGMGVQVYWDATVDVLAWYLPADKTDTLDFTQTGGLRNFGGAGVTGDIRFTTQAGTPPLANGDGYSIIFWMVKNYG